MPQSSMVYLLDSVPPDDPETASHALCAVAMAPDGTLTVAALRPVPCADASAWTSLLWELRAAAADPVLVCCDGTPAVVRAVEAAFPGVAIQYSIPHRLAAMRCSMDGRGNPGCTEEARRIFQAGDREAAAARFRAWRARWLAQGERAVRGLETDLARYLAFYRLPRPLRSRARSVCVVRHVVRRAARRAAAPHGQRAAACKPDDASSAGASAPPDRPTPAQGQASPSPARPLPEHRARARTAFREPRSAGDVASAAGTRHVGHDTTKTAACDNLDVASAAGTRHVGRTPAGLPPSRRDLLDPFWQRHRRPTVWAVVGAAALVATVGAWYLPGLSPWPSAVAQHRTAPPPPRAPGALHPQAAPGGAGHDTLAAGGPATRPGDGAAAGAPAPPSIAAVTAHVAAPPGEPVAGPGSAGGGSNAAPGGTAEPPRIALPARGEAIRGVSVMLRATGRSWLRVTVDGVRVFEGVVRAGEVREWTARRVVHLRTGNAGAADLTVNGRRLGVPGRVGQIASLTVTPSGVRP